MSGPRIVFCSNNHIYDASLYDACPYCSKVEAERKEIVAPSGADDPYGATVVGTGPISTDGSFVFGESFGGAASGSFSETESKSEVSQDDSETGSESDVFQNDPESDSGAFRDDPGSDSEVFRNDPGSGWSADGAESEQSDEEEIPEFKIPFFTKDGMPDPRNIDTSMGLAESMNGSSSVEDEESGKESEEAEKTLEKGEEAEKTPEEEEGAVRLSKEDKETVSQDSVQKDTDDPAATGYWESDDPYEEEDEWESFPLKNEGPVRGWFVLQNGIQKDHSIELCRKSTFMYDYEGMCLVFSSQMENMTLLATIEQYKTIAILPEPGVPFEVNGEARRSCGRLGAYMKLLIGSHQMVYVPVDDRLLNGER